MEVFARSFILHWPRLATQFQEIAKFVPINKNHVPHYSHESSATKIYQWIMEYMEPLCVLVLGKHQIGSPGSQCLKPGCTLVESSPKTPWECRIMP